MSGRVLLAAGLASAILAAPADAIPKLGVETVSNRPELISGGDALVTVQVPRGIALKRLTVTAGEREVTAVFTRRKGRLLTGLIEGLPEGDTVVTATAPLARRGRLRITNHPLGGPVFSGPQIHPWVCQPTAIDAQCNEPVRFAFSYRRTDGSWAEYDPDDPPSDVSTTKTQTGVTVPFIVRTETGYMDRDQYAISVIYDPEKPWSGLAPQAQFNRKLLVTHGASCGIDHQSGEAPSTTSDTVAVPGVPDFAGAGSSPTTALGMGFAVMSTALNNAGHNCNLVTQAESMVMAKEHIVERYGELRYTIGTGCSGGSLTQQQVANAYPGIYQGILPQCSFPDAWSTGNQLADYHFGRLYFENPTRWAPGVVWDPVSIGAVEGHPNHVNAIILDQLYFTALGVPDNPCAGVSDEERYSESNPDGVRCTLADYMVNVLGRRADGFAGRPLDDVGVQYGLGALLAGQISQAQFVDLNVKAGGADIDANPVAERSAADEPALLNANRSGAINDGSNLDQTAIIDLRGSDDGAFHDAYRAFAVRARLDREHGHHDNQVIWLGPVPLVGGTDYTVRGLMAMDTWLAEVEKDKRAVSVAQRIRENKPKDIVDQCELPTGQVEPGLDCPEVVRVYATPRMVAGDSIATDTNKCQLKPFDPAGYGDVQFSAARLEQLREVFATGVCDYTKPAVDSEGPTLPWMNYDSVVGGKPLRARDLSAGWASRAFRNLRGPKAARIIAARALKRRSR